jgi:multidrug efflux pump subunit AcrA (membrane-fusion protein)
VLADVGNRADRLRPGMSFEVRLVLRGERLVSVPELALQWGQDGAFVWTIVDGQARRTAVRLVRRAEARVLVRPDAGAVRTVAAGDRVVVEGVHRLHDGQPVRVVEHAGIPDA